MAALQFLQPLQSDPSGTSSAAASDPKKASSHGRMLKTTAGNLFPIYSCVNLTKPNCLNSIGMYGLITDSVTNKTVSTMDRQEGGVGSGWMETGADDHRSERSWNIIPTHAPHAFFIFIMPLFPCPSSNALLPMHIPSQPGCPLEIPFIVWRHSGLC